MTFYISPYRRMMRMRNVMDRMLANDFGDTRTPVRNRVHIPLDVQAHEDEFVIRALIPGLSSEDLDIQVLDNTVTIRGELKSLREDESDHLLQEIPAGEFARTMRLPAALDAEKAEATIVNGVLRLWVPKAESARAKKIEVKVS